MAQERSGLIEALDTEQREQLKAYMSILGKFLPFFDNMYPAQQAEYNRIEWAVREIAEERQRILNELEPLAQESATITEKREYVTRTVALFERHIERLGRLNKDFQRLLIDVVAQD